MFHRWVGALVGLAMLAMAGTANATLIGSTVGYDRIFNGADVSGLGTAIVGAGAEFSEFGRVFSDLDASSVSLTFVVAQIGFTFEGQDDGIRQFIQYTGLTWVDDPTALIESISVGFGGTITNFGLAAPFSAAEVSFSGNTIKINVGGYFFFPGAFVDVAITPAHAVPEPSTLALFGIGLAGLGFMTRRRKRRQPVQAALVLGGRRDV